MYRRYVLVKKSLNKLRKIRQKRKLSYSEVEKLAGISREKLKSFEEEGFEHLTISEFDRLLALYKVTYEDILDLHKPKFTRNLVKWLLPLVFIGIFSIYFIPSDMRIPFLLVDSEKIGDTHERIASTDMDVDIVNPDMNDMGTHEVSHESEEIAVVMADEMEESEPPQEQRSETLPKEETVVFRFWGNIPYSAAEIPKIGNGGADHVIEIVPIEHLSDVHPAWLQGKEKDQLIINAGTSDVWTPTTVQAYQQLQEDNFQVMGLGTAPDVYEPYIIEVNAKKIGFLPLAGLIHHAEEIALPSRIGLARAYRTDEVNQAVSEAKSKVDFLFVLMHWGNKWTDELNMAQKVIAPAIVEAGGDMVIGNHPYQSQDMLAMDGTPVFYALGHSVFGYNEEDAFIYDKISYNYVVEVVFSNQVDHIRLRVGKMNDGMLDFQLSPDDHEQIVERLGTKENLFENFEILLPQEMDFSK